MTEHDLLACPICSHPPALISRPLLVCGVRSKRWMIVTALHCDHMPVMQAANIADEPAPLVSRWNAWAEAEATKRIEHEGHTPDRAEKFRAALLPHRYSRPT